MPTRTTAAPQLRGRLRMAVAAHADAAGALVTGAGRASRAAASVPPARAGMAAMVWWLLRLATRRPREHRSA